MDTQNLSKTTQPCKIAMAHNLNHLYCFTVIYEERNLTKAGKKVGKAQSHMSNVLKTLRDTFKDKLFVRGDSQMQPTKKADDLYQDIKLILQNVTQLMTSKAFDPAAAQHHFNIGVHPCLEVLLADRLVQLNWNHPQLDFNLRTHHQFDDWSLFTQKSLDVGIGVHNIKQSGVVSQPLCRKAFQVVMDQQHPLALKVQAGHGDGAMISIDDYTTYRHIISSNQHDLVDSNLNFQLERLGIRRQVMLEGCTQRELYTIIKDTEYLLTQPVFDESVLHDAGLVALPLPFETDPLQVDLIWHRHSDDDPALQWLRHLIITSVIA